MMNETLAPSIGEKCGVFGVYGQGFEAARLVYPGLWALQHRGQESSGIAVSDGERIKVHKGVGLVAHVYGEEDLDVLTGQISIGHNRYGTSQKSSGEHHSQPVLRRDKSLALAHNGNLPSVARLEGFLQGNGIPTTTSNDSEMMTDAIRHLLSLGVSLEEAIAESMPLFTGAYSLLLLIADKLAALRDPRGIRPLSIGELNGGYIISSETNALDIVHANPIRDVRPGELVVVDEGGLHSYQLAKGDQRLDIFEFVYFARPDSILLGKSVYGVRWQLGANLFQECPTCADVVLPVPDSAVPAAIGYAHASGIPFEEGLIKNRYIHRTFIRPEQRLRERDVAMKLNPIPSVLAGKRVIVIDDSIVRGTTARNIVRMIREAGAREVHLRIPSPPVLYPDFYGIDTPKQSDLIAARMSLKGICEFVGADSLFYLSYRGLINSTGLPESVFSTSCFTGEYPIGIGERAREVQKIIFKSD